MALETSILKSVKKNLGLDAGYTAFDHDVITHINMSFFNLNQLGIGPAEGFMIEDDQERWIDFVDASINLSAQNALQTYIYLKVRAIFDPPGTPHHIAAIKEQIVELEHRLLTERELTKWGAPGAPGDLLFEDQVILDGGVG